MTVRAFDPEPIQADKNIVAHAKMRNGQFSPVHVYLEENNSEEYTKAHERRLEALGRANVVSKNENGAWDIPDDYLDRVREYHKELAKRLPAPLARDSVLTLSQMEKARGATWLDEQLSTGRLEEERTSK